MQELKLASKKILGFETTFFSICCLKGHTPPYQEVCFECRHLTGRPALVRSRVTHIAVYDISAFLSFEINTYLVLTSSFEYLLSACLVVPTSGTLFTLYQWEKLSLE